ncbi:MAG: heme/hemin ABC transporter substrate-binding protein, partial [Oceanobacter sp.]
MNSIVERHRGQDIRWRWLLLAASILMLFIAQVQASPYSSKAMRVVSIDGSLTEIIYALNAQGRLVGVDTTSRYPQAATQLPQVGYMRQLSVEGILSLMPDLVIATPDAGPESVFQQLKEAKVRVLIVPNDYSLTGVLNKV